MTDKRYSIALEYCGHARRRWIVRFCGSWIGMGKNRADADAIARQHEAARWQPDSPRSGQYPYEPLDVTL